MSVAFMNIEPDGRLTVITEDGAATSAEPMGNEIPPEARGRLADLLDGSITVTGHWDAPE